MESFEFGAFTGTRAIEDAGKESSDHAFYVDEGG